jgi:ADP-heptose:LPS heptosyltransferase
MKYFNQKKIKKKKIAIGEIVFRILHFFLLTVKKIFLVDNTPCLLLVDGYRVGDSILLRPLIKGLIERFSATHKIIVLSGKHALHVYSDYLDQIEIINYQFPWASYDYSISSLKKLLTNWYILYGKSVEIAIESRGDFRSISWTYLSCPKRLIGFDFTGGARLLTAVIPDDGKIAHLFEHVKRIGSFIGCEVEAENIRLQKHEKIVNVKKRIAISFSGSQPLRNLPVTVGLGIIRRLMEETDFELWYVMSPSEINFSRDLLENNFGNKVKIFSGDFDAYFVFLQTSDIYIGMDSGGGHLCSLWGIPSVIIFGTQPSAYASPVGKHPKLFLENESSLPCRPCDGVACINDAGFQKCFTDLETDKIIAFCKTFIDHQLHTRRQFHSFDKYH